MLVPDFIHFLLISIVCLCCFEYIFFTELKLNLPLLAFFVYALSKGSVRVWMGVRYELKAKLKTKVVIKECCKYWHWTTIILTKNP